MLSPRWLIGLTMFLVVAFMICNFIDGNPFLTNDQTQSVVGMTEHSDVQVTSTQGGGGLIVYLNIAMRALGLITKALSWDFSFFHDIDPATGLDANSEMGLILLGFRLMFMTISVGVIFQMAYLLRQIITG